MNLLGKSLPNNILTDLKISTIKNTNIIKISYSSPNADEARRLSNLIASSYVDTIDIEAEKMQ